jgi:hypothetical protein
MRASDPAGYDGIEKLVAVTNPTATGRGLLLTASAAGNITLDITTNEVDQIIRNYENGTTTVAYKQLKSVTLYMAASTTMILPIVGTFELSSSSNVIAYVLR